jgi:hypothetical protein
MKTYYAHVQFEAVEVRVSAKDMRQARKKVLTKVGKMKPRRLLDRHNFFVEREP